ncbi:MAG: elongation factor Ts [Geminicoccaceae bacterium]|nr:elongation factor Ts [Geminicoccaceae bacterium]MCB2010396.1 elongation factor Ts [Geminicoccaceae bacterium]
MAEITAALVKQLREKTGAGMMDCKRALGETDGDMEEAIDWLRKKGLAAAAKKAGRITSEGLIALSLAGNRGAVVEVNSETDFVARNEQFQELVTAIAGVATEARGDLDALLALTLPSTGKSVADSIADAVGVIGENIQLRRTAFLEVDAGAVGGYVHAQQAPGLGKIGVLVAIASAGDAEQVGELGRQIAMHVAATSPQSVDIASLDPAVVERERNVLADQARASGKPENIIEKMVEGRLRKFYEESVLLEQVYVIDTDKHVKDAVADTAKALGSPVEVRDFVRMALGEGVEKKDDDLAAEVARLAG